MTALTVFLFFAVMLIYLSFLFLLPIFSRRAERAVDQNTLNIQLYKNKLQELVRDLENNAIDKQQYIAAEAELKQQLLEDTGEDTAKDDNESAPRQAAAGDNTRPYRLALAVVLFIPALSFALYLLFGQPDSLRKSVFHPQTGSQARNDTGRSATRDKPKPPSVESVRKMIKLIRKKLKQDPENPTAWIMLARAYTYIREFGPAADTYQMAMKYNKNNPGLLANYADVLASAHGGKIAGKSLELVLQALKLKPDHPKALNLAGTAYFQAKDYKKALHYWEKLYNLLPAGSPYASAIRASINDARKQLGMQPIAARKNDTKGKTQAKKFTISGKVSLDDRLKQKLTGKETVYIIAKAVSGPPMPIAVLKKTVAELPLDFTLDDSHAMSPNFRLSMHKRVVVFARIVKHAGVRRQPGDIESSPVTVSRGSKKITLLIDRIQ